MNTNQTQTTPSPLGQLLITGLMLWGGIKLIDEISYQAEQKKTKKDKCSACPTIFSAHSWTYSRHYENQMQRLAEAGFCVDDVSVPKDKPLPSMSKPKLLKQIEKRIKKSSTVLVFGGDYFHHSEYIKEEVKIAQRLGKEILTIMPKGRKRTPKFLQENTKVIGTHTTRLIQELTKSCGI